MRLYQLDDDPFKVLFHNGDNGDILLIAGHHGNETIGWNMLQYVVDHLDQITELPITIIPFASPGAVKNGTRNFAGKDPNRVYKDYTHGSDWSKRIVDQLIGKKLVVDFHGADNDPQKKVPFIICSKKGEWTKYFPKVDIEIREPPIGSFRWLAEELGATCITIEGLNRNNEDSMKIADDLIYMLKVRDDKQ